LKTVVILSTFKNTKDQDVQNNNSARTGLELGHYQTKSSFQICMVENHSA